MKIYLNYENVVYRYYGEYCIVYHLDSKNFFVFNETAKDIFLYIENHENIDIDCIYAYVNELYDVESKELLQNDVLEFVNTLVNNDIVILDRIQNSQNNIYNSTAILDNVESKIVNICKHQNQLYAATIEMTWRCNENCIHCYALNSKIESLPLMKYINIIDQLYDLGCMNLSFTGGDPFVYPNFFDILQYASKKKFIIDIFTNGLYISDNPSIINELCYIKPKAIYISLYGSTSSIHDNITRTPGSFEKTLFAIKELRKAGITVVLNIMLIKQNYKDFLSILNLIKELDVEYRVGLSIIKKNDGDDTPLDSFINDKKAIIKIMKMQNMQYMYNLDRNINYDNDDPLICGAGKISICISPTGEVYPCVSLKISFGSILTSSLSSIWYDKKRIDKVDILTWDNTEKCSICDVKTFCPHCPGISQAETGNPFSCNYVDSVLANCAKEVS